MDCGKEKEKENEKEIEKNLFTKRYVEVLWPEWSEKCYEIAEDSFERNINL